MDSASDTRARKSDVSFLSNHILILDPISSDKIFPQDFSIDPNMKIRSNIKMIYYTCVFRLFREILQTTILLLSYEYICTLRCCAKHF